MRRMKQRNTDPEKQKQRQNAVRSVAFSVAFRLLAVLFLLWTRPAAPWPWLHELLLCVAVLGLVTIPFALVVLHQRLREIEKGELDEARKY